jgi:predicted KAP-like P-loop ATPase
MILSDNETKVDLLNYEAIAATIVELLRQRPEQPMTIGVHGDWGAGKSSVLEMIEAALEKDDKALCLKFNGWRFQGFDDAKIALIEGIVAGLLEKRPALSKATEIVKDVFQRIDWLKVAKNAGGLAITAHTGIPMPGQIEGILHAAEAVIADPAKAAKELQSTVTGLKGLLKPDTHSKSAPKEIEEFRKAFDKLLKAADIDQLVVLIDDLDRCLPDTAIETLEAVRLFVFTSRTAFVVAADEAMIEYAVRKHFPDLPDTTGPLTYSRNYLEKLIQVPFRIPALGDIETRIYVTLLLVGTGLGDNNQAFRNLISLARERLKRPWTSAPFDTAAAKGALGDGFASVQTELFLSEQIGPTLAAGTNGNPRQIKRFLNAMILRQRTAQARGFGDEVK